MVVASGFVVNGVPGCPAAAVHAVVASPLMFSMMTKSQSMATTNAADAARAKMDLFATVGIPGCTLPFYMVLAAMSPTFRDDCAQLMAPPIVVVPVPGPPPAGGGNPPPANVDWLPTQPPLVQADECDTSQLQPVFQSDDSTACQQDTTFSFAMTKDPPDNTMKTAICQSTACLKTVVALRQVDLPQCAVSDFAMVRDLLTSINHDCDELVLKPRYN